MITKLYNINDPSRFLHMWPVSLNLLGEVGRPQRWDHLLWQHWLCHAHSLPGIAIESTHPAEQSLRVAIPKSPARFASPSHPNPHSMRISCFIIPSQCVTMEGWINILYWVSFCLQEIQPKIVANLFLSIRLTMLWGASSTGSTLSLSSSSAPSSCSISSLASSVGEWSTLPPRHCVFSHTKRYPFVWKCLVDTLGFKTFLNLESRIWGSFNFQRV